MPDRRRLTNREKIEVAQRADGCCEYCQSQARFSSDPFSIEHITPRSHGGETTLDNLAFACQGCNNHKYISTEAIDSISGEMFPLFNPRQQMWQHNFVWSDNFSEIIGITPTVRATIEKLQLNRQGLINLRRISHSVGEHPPTHARK